MAVIGKPLQIYLRPDQNKTLRAVVARREGAALPVEDDPGLRLVSLGRAGRGDVAERHDEILVKVGREGSRAIGALHGTQTRRQRQEAVFSDHRRVAMRGGLDNGMPVETSWVSGV